MPTIIYLRRPGGDEEPIELDPGTTEFHFPDNLYLSGGATPDHVHHFRSRNPVAVFVPVEQCRWHKAGYR